jgi:plasmid stabilization system protein ParE
MLESAILGLDASPERCVVAPESESIEAFEIRQLLVGNYRVLFTIRERTVFVLHIRHGSRKVASPSEIAQATGDWPRSSGGA